MIRVQSEFEPDPLEKEKAGKATRGEREEGGRTQTAGARVFHESEILFRSGG